MQIGKLPVRQCRVLFVCLLVFLFIWNLGYNWYRWTTCQSDNAESCLLPFPSPEILHPPLLASSTISPLFSISLICSQRAKWMLAGRSLAYFVVSATMFASKKVCLPLSVCLHSPRLCWQWECCLVCKPAPPLTSSTLFYRTSSSPLWFWPEREICHT